MNNIFCSILLFILLFLGKIAFAQTVIKGKVTDKNTQEALPFVSVYFEGTPDGTFTDEMGFYTLESANPKDSVTVSFFGYTTIKQSISKGKNQEINFAMSSEAEQLETIVLTNKEDPAVRLIKKAIKAKGQFDKRNLKAYEFESFTTIVAGFDKLPENLKKGKMARDINSILDSLIKIKGEDASVPFFASEAVSRVYVRTEPEKISETIMGTKVSGVFVEDGSLVSQLIGSSFQNYNFYKNWVNIVDKDFISPIADGAFNYYDFRLSDTLTIENRSVYVVRVIPKRDQDLAFRGEIYIQDSTFALTGADLSISKDANLNYVGSIKIKQELKPTEAGPWLPSFTQVYIRFTGLSENWAGLEATFKSYNSDFIVNQPKELKFYDQPINVNEDASLQDSVFWNIKRQTPLSEEDKQTYALIDSVKNIPSVKSFVEVVDIAVNGYLKAGPLDIGPYLYAYAWNHVEGSRLRLGFRTNKKFSNKWVLSGFAAYGFRDQLFKYYGQVNYIANRKKWTELWLGYKFDIDQIAIPEDKLEGQNNLFLAFTRWGKLIGPTYNRNLYVGASRQFTKDFSQKLLVRKKSYDPLFDYNIIEKGKPSDSLGRKILNTSEIILESRYARDEIFVQNDNSRISLGTRKWPVFRARYTLGIKDVFLGELNYHKVDLMVSDNFKFGFLGRSYIDLHIGKIFSSVPLPLLEVHLGNESPFYTTAGFNLMNYFEFVSDEFINLKYRHYFQGLIMNRIPLVRKLKWRSLVTAGVLYGNLSNKNNVQYIDNDTPDNSNSRFGSLKDKPYVELGYGIENIFKIFRVDAFHRITYLDNPGANKFGVKFSVQFSL
jgi:hypothetical protein